MSRLLDMATEAGEQVGRTDAAFLSYLKKAINRRYREILSRHQWSEMNREFTVTVASGATKVGLPSQVQIVHAAYNVTECEWMRHMALSEMEERLGSGLSSAGTLSYYAILGTKGALADFSGSDVPTALSSSAADSCVVTISGYDSNQLPYTSTATVNGTTAISFSPTFSADGATVESFSKDRDTAGTISLQQATPGVIGKIPPTERVARYTWLRFNAAASSAVTIRVQARMHAPDLVSDEAVPLLLDIDHILVCGAVADALRKLNSFSKAGFEEQRFQNLLESHVAMRGEEGGGIQASGSMHYYRG